MFAATHFDNLLVLFFFGIAFVFQLVSAAAAKKRKQRDEQQRRSTSPSQKSRPLTTEVDQTDEERIRKFLEALGQPASSKPPPPARPRPTYRKPDVLPHVGPFAPTLPPLKTRPPDLPVERTPPIIPKRESPILRPKVVEAPLTTAPVVETAAEAYAIAPQPIIKSTERRNDIITMLRSTSGLRDAMILREIFGPPRSMQPLDLVGNA
jgi:hypothetical protein